ncbi:MAG TPA: N-acetyltransferase [Candidatus Poseidoniales archaeon]|jgi:predicted GNAT family acetyltransferase|nr:N-acetyltransferase [Candidatus Poseidoniales archaeon]
MESGEGLLKWKSGNLDLERPLSAEKETKRLQQVPHELLIIEGNSIGHAALRRLGSTIELHTVVISPEQRGKGYSHILVEMVLRRWHQDRILHSASIQPPVDLAAAMRGDKPVEEVWRRSMICFTRHPSLAATLTASGFVHAQKKRRWWALWLRRHPLGILSTRTLLSLLLNRVSRAVKMLVLAEKLPERTKNTGKIRTFFQHRRRLFHQLAHLSDNRLFILKPASSLNLHSQRDGEDIEDKLKGMGLDITIHTQDRDKDLRKEESESWDRGAKDEPPLVDLTEEE